MDSLHNGEHCIRNLALIGAFMLLVGCGGGEVSDPVDLNPVDPKPGGGSSSSSSSSSSSGGVAGNPVLEQGKKLFVKQCEVCHGPTGQGTGLARNIRENWPTVKTLIEKIDFSMPPNADDRCDLKCSKELSAYILAGYDTTGEVHPDIVFEVEKPKVSTLKALSSLPGSTSDKVYSARSAVGVPQTIEGEHFDTGGEGVSYSDTTPGNVGTQPNVRNETDVDFGIYDGVISLGWFVPDEWVEFSFYIEDDATLNVDWQVSSARDERGFKWSINGQEQSTVDVPNTGDWGAFVSISSATPHLAKGWHTIRVEILNGFNLDKLELSLASRQPIDTVDLDHEVVSKVIHRLTKTEYLNTVNTLFEGDFSEVVAEFDTDKFGEGFDRVAELLSVDKIRLKRFMSAAEKISESVMADNAKASRILSCSLNAGTVNTCGATIVRDWGFKFARRPLSSAEVDKHLVLLRSRLSADASADEAVQHWLRAMLVSMSFLHHVELEPNSTADTDTFSLSPYELVNRMSYFVWCTMPDKTLFDLAESGEIMKDDVMSQQIDRMLADSKSSCLVDTIAAQWLDLGKVESRAASVDPSQISGWNLSLADDMVEETKAFVMHLIQQNRPVAELMSASYSFMSEELAAFYDLSAPDQNGRVDLAGSERRGLLTQGSVMTLTGQGEKYIHRGIFVLKNLLCDPPPPPVNVDTSMETSDCQGCHRFIDPVGIGLESFNSVGQFSSVDEMGNAILTESAFFNGPSFSGPMEMVEILQEDERLPACVMEKFIAYAHAVAPEEFDQKAKDSAVAAWDQSGLGFRDILKTIVTSPSFKYRRLTSAE